MRLIDADRLKHDAYAELGRLGVADCVRDAVASLVDAMPTEAAPDAGSTGTPREARLMGIIRESADGLRASADAWREDAGFLKNWADSLRDQADFLEYRVKDLENRAGAMLAPLRPCARGGDAAEGGMG